jgi:hypothetical protein
MMKKVLAATVALSLGAAPTLAQSAASTASPALANESLSGSEQLGEGGSFIAPAIAGIIVVLGILLATDTWPFDEDDEDPVSP